MYSTVLFKVLAMCRSVMHIIVIILMTVNRILDFATSESIHTEFSKPKDGKGWVYLPNMNVGCVLKSSYACFGCLGIWCATSLFIFESEFSFFALSPFPEMRDKYYIHAR
jgi:hypothetical protein